MTQSVERLTLDFGSGNDLRVAGLSPMSGSALKMWSLLESLSLPLSLCPAPSHTHCLQRERERERERGRERKEKRKEGRREEGRKKVFESVFLSLDFR